MHLLQCTPNYRIWFRDGTAFRLSTDLAAMKAQIERWEGPAGYARYLAFLQEAHAHYELSVEHVLRRDHGSLWALLRPGFVRHLLRLHPFESLWTRAGKFFWTERLRRVFTFGSMYMGMSPFDAPGTYSLLQYTELAEGIWYPVGGFHRVVDALVAVGRRAGVQLRLNAAVAQILLDSDGTAVKGVRLQSGETLHADVVVNNTDLVYAYTNLLPQHTAYARALAARPASCSSISFYWALNTTLPQLEAHNIFLASAYRASFDTIFKSHTLPQDPSFYLNVPSRIDPSAAPAGHDALVALVPVGHLGPPDQDWPQLLARARSSVLAALRQRTGVDLEPLIVAERTNTPLTWKASFNLDRGAILGLSHSFFNVLCFRPRIRARRPAALDGVAAGLGAASGGALETVAHVLTDSFRPRAARDVRGLYMVGASAHPGTGVPICLAGAALVAECVLADLGVVVVVPWAAPKVAGGKGGKPPAEAGGDGTLDVLARPLWRDGWTEWVGIAVVGVSLAWVVVLAWVVGGWSPLPSWLTMT